MAKKLFKWITKIISIYKRTFSAHQAVPTIFDGHPIIAYVLLCEDQVECPACGISQMNQPRIETLQSKATMP